MVIYVLLCVLLCAAEISSYYDNEGYSEDNVEEYRNKLVHFGPNDLEGDSEYAGSRKYNYQDKRTYIKTSESYDDNDGSLASTLKSTLDKDALNEISNIEIDSKDSSSTNKPSSTVVDTNKRKENSISSTISTNEYYEYESTTDVPNIQTTALNNAHIKSSSANAEESRKELKTFIKQIFFNSNKLPSTSDATSAKKELVAYGNYSSIYYADDISQAITKSKAKININKQKQANAHKIIKYSNDEPLNITTASEYISTSTTDSYYESVDNITESIYQENYKTQLTTKENTENNTQEQDTISESTVNDTNYTSLKDYLSTTPTDMYYESDNVTESVGNGNYKNYMITKENSENNTQEQATISESTVNDTNYTSLIDNLSTTPTDMYYESDNVTESVGNGNYKNYMITKENSENNTQEQATISESTVNDTNYTSLIDYLSTTPTDMYYESANVTDSVDDDITINKKITKTKFEYKTEDQVAIESTVNYTDSTSLIDYVSTSPINIYYEYDNVTEFIVHENYKSQSATKPKPEHKISTEDKHNYIDDTSINSLKYISLVHYMNRGRINKDQDAMDVTDSIAYENNTSQRETKWNQNNKMRTKENSYHVDDTLSNSLKYVPLVHYMTRNSDNVADTIKAKTKKVYKNSKLKVSKNVKNKFGDYHSIATYSTYMNEGITDILYESDNVTDSINYKNYISQSETISKPKHKMNTIGKSNYIGDTSSSSLKYVSLVHYMNRGRANKGHVAVDVTDVTDVTDSIYYKKDTNQHETKPITKHKMSTRKYYNDNNRDSISSNSLRYVSLVHYMTRNRTVNADYVASTIKRETKKTKTSRNGKNKFGDYHSIATYSTYMNRGPTDIFYISDNVTESIEYKNYISQSETKPTPKSNYIEDSSSNNLKYVSHHRHDVHNITNIIEREILRNNNKFGDYHSMATYSSKVIPANATKTFFYDIYDYPVNGSDSKNEKTLNDTEMTVTHFNEDRIKEKIANTDYDYETKDVTATETISTMASTTQLIVQKWVEKQGLEIGRKPQLPKNISDAILQIFGPFYEIKATVIGDSASKPAARTGVNIQETTLIEYINPFILRNTSDVPTPDYNENGTTTPVTTTTTTAPYTGPFIDVPALLDIIADFVEEYDTNLTEQLNNTLWERKIPTCKTLPSHTPELDYDTNVTRPGSVVAKCFVCGLDDYGIPRSAACSDAFAGDFIALLPIDQTAKSRLSKFRKYCKYKNSYSVWKNTSDRQSLYGRWTGGCSVRWTDVTTVYTQRSCRNKHRAVMGKHFASKRMAKLENALKDTENGCIISPMAVLTPLSRGISLYARFHACVCTGNWCNGVDGLQHSISLMLLAIMVSELILILKFG